MSVTQTRAPAFASARTITAPMPPRAGDERALARQQLMIRHVFPD
jgi:hypothetical protein